LRREPVQAQGGVVHLVLDVASTSIRPTDMGFAAEGQLTRGLGRLCGASPSLGSVLHL